MAWNDEITKAGKPAQERIEAGRRDQPFLIEIAGPTIGELFKLDRERTVIGRGAQAHVRILDDGVSREHCEIQRRDGAALLVDRGSTNGTYCRGQRADAPIELQDGDKVMVGANVVLKFNYGDRLDEMFQRQMFESALRDDLTRVFNRRYFKDRLESEYAFAVRHRSVLALITLDLDRFKRINDEHGHPAGDHVLREVAGVLAPKVRVEDVFARVGGEEFAVICRATDAAQAQIVAERLRRTVENLALRYGGQALEMTISVGIAAIPDPGIGSLQDLITAADVVLYAAKQAGRNRIGVWPRDRPGG